jgi:hypothetical protein
VRCNGGQSTACSPLLARTPRRLWRLKRHPSKGAPSARRWCILDFPRGRARIARSKTRNLSNVTEDQANHAVVGTSGATFTVLLRETTQNGARERQAWVQLVGHLIAGERDVKRLKDGRCSRAQIGQRLIWISAVPYRLIFR